MSRKLYYILVTPVGNLLYGLCQHFLIASVTIRITVSTGNNDNERMNKNAFRYFVNGE